MRDLALSIVLVHLMIAAVLDVPNHRGRIWYTEKARLEMSG